MFSSTNWLEPGWDYTGSVFYYNKKVSMIVSASSSISNAFYYYYTYYYGIVCVSGNYDELSELLLMFRESSFVCNLRYYCLERNKRSSSAR